jgi:hypothetical protein
MKKKTAGRERKQIMKKQKKKGITTVNTTGKTKIEKIDFGTMRTTMVRLIWK